MDDNTGGDSSDPLSSSVEEMSFEMNDEKLARYHETLSMLRPKGRSGGLGLGSFGTMKKGDDGLPNNALYSRFVKEGAGSYQHKKFEEEVADVDEEDDPPKKKSKKSKKELKKVDEDKEIASSKKEKVKERKTKSSESDTESKVEVSKLKKSKAVFEEEEVSSTKKKRKRPVQPVESEAEEEEEDPIDWTSAIKCALKAAPERKMNLKYLQLAVFESLGESIGSLKKKHKKALFRTALESMPKVKIDADDVCSLKNKKKV